MQTSTQPLEIHVPYAMRHLTGEVKNRNGRFDGTTKLWTMPDTEANRSFAAQFQVPPRTKASPEERIKSVAQTCTELLNGLRVGQFNLVESTSSRIVIEGRLQA